MNFILFITLVIVTAIFLRDLRRSEPHHRPLRRNAGRSPRGPDRDGDPLPAMIVRSSNPQTDLS
jgi:hypothetical protein